MSVSAGLTLSGDAYPVERKWTSTVAAATLPFGSQIIIWDEPSQGYGTPIRKTFFGWGTEGNALTTYPGRGYWIRNTNAVTWTETKPYTWP